MLCLTFMVSEKALSQQLYTKGLLKADKLFIKKEYGLAALYYTAYLEKYPRDYYASRQAAICYDYVDDHYSAIDHWPAVVENSESTEQDFLSYGRCLLQNDREPDAKKILGVLIRSKNNFYAAWGRAYQNPRAFYMDTARWRLAEVKDLNTPAFESSPALYSNKLLYNVDQIRNPRAYSPAGDQSGQSMVAVTYVDTLFFTPSDLMNNLRNQNMYGQVSFSPDGQLMYFSKAVTSDEAGLKSSFPYSRFQIFYLNMSSVNDRTPDIRPFQFNSMLYDFIHPCLSPDGQRLFFASDMKSSFGGKDIYMCEKVNDAWGPPIHLGREVNTPGNEVYPHFLADGSLYFASDGRPGMGGLDLFLSKPATERAADFQDARNMGAPFNSRYNDFGICFLRDTLKGYLSSDRKNGTDDDLFYFYNREN